MGIEVTTDSSTQRTCQKCDHKWNVRLRDREPKSCPACKQYKWNEPKSNKQDNYAEELAESENIMYDIYD